jgi:hypothetical protein
MGRVAIARVRFGHAPASYHQFQSVKGADWVYVTVQAPLQSAKTTLRQQDRRDWLLWQAVVFERAYLSGMPNRATRIRGTSENVRDHGVAQQEASETSQGIRWPRRQPDAQALIARITRAGRAAGFAVRSITITHPDRLAATAGFTVSTHRRFAHRFNSFYSVLNTLGDRLDGLAWQLRDRCGTLVAQSAYGWYVNPRWECPEPGIIGLAPTLSECRKLAAQYPAC